MLSDREEIAEKSVEEIFAFPDTREMAAELRQSWEQKGAEIHFLFWDPKDDKTVTIEKDIN